MSQDSTVCTDLAALQRWMQDCLITPGRNSRANLADTLLPGPMLDAAGCLAIYQRSYILRLRKCLAEQFPATLYALGHDLFDDFADTYLRACPSDSYTLYQLGRRFPAWLEQTRIDRDLPPAEREGWIDFMVDLASYERELFHLFDAPGYEGQKWPEQNCDDRTLVLQSCLVLAQYRYPVAWYYHEVRAERNPDFPAAADAPVVILRRNYRTTSYPVTALHMRFLLALQEHGNIPLALEEIASQTQQPVAAIRQSWVEEVRQPWIDAGFFVVRPQ